MSTYADGFSAWRQQQQQANQPTPSDPLDAFVQRVDEQERGVVRERNLQTRSAPVRGMAAGVDILQALGGGALALAGKAVGSDWAIRKGMDVYQRNMDEASLNPSKVEFAELVDDPNLDKALEWTGYTLGNLLPSMAEAAGGAALGSVVAPGPGTAAGGFLGKTILKKGIQTLAAEMAESAVKQGVTRELAQAAAEKVAARAMLKSFGAKAGAVGATWQMEGGGNFAEAVEHVGLDEASVGSALATGAASALLETAGGNIRLIDRIFGTEAGKAVKRAVEKGDARLVARVFKEAAIQAPAEAAQEMGQEFFSLVNLAVNDPQFQMLTSENAWRLAESGAAGAVGGLAIGGATGVLPKRGGMIEPTAEQSPSTVPSTPAARGMAPAQRDPRTEAVEQANRIWAQTAPPVAPVAPAKPAGTLEKAVAKAAPVVAPVGPVGGMALPPAVAPVVDSQPEMEQGGFDGGLSEVRQEAGGPEAVPPVRGTLVDDGELLAEALPLQPVDDLPQPPAEPAKAPVVAGPIPDYLRDAIRYDVKSIADLEPGHVGGILSTWEGPKAQQIAEGIKQYRPDLAEVVDQFMAAAQPVAQVDPVAEGGKVVEPVSSATEPASSVSEPADPKPTYPALKRQAKGLGVGLSTKQADGLFAVTSKEGAEQFRGTLAQVADHFAGAGKAIEQETDSGKRAEVLPLAQVHGRMGEVTGYDISPQNAELEREFFKEEGGGAVLNLTAAEFERKLQRFIDKKKQQSAKEKDSTPGAGEAVESKDQGPHYAAGRDAFKSGKPRELPSYFTVSNGKNPKDWFRGWDAASKEGRDSKESNAPIRAYDLDTRMWREVAPGYPGLRLNASNSWVIDKPDPPLAAVKESLAPAEPAQPARVADDRKAVGKNRDGKELFEDKIGVRFYVENGVKIGLATKIVPVRGQGMVPQAFSPREIFKSGDLDFLTTEELQGFEPKAEPAEAVESKAPEKPIISAAVFFDRVADRLNGNGKLKAIAPGSDQQNFMIAYKDAYRKAVAEELHYSVGQGAGVADAHAQALKVSDEQLQAYADAFYRAHEGGSRMAGQDDKKAEPAKEKPEAKPEAGNTVFTEDAYLKARAVMKAKLSQVNAGIDPELMQAGFTIAGYHIEKGSRKFVNYAAAMIEDFGEAIKPYLKSFYNGVRDLPGIDQITGEMDSYQSVANYDVERFTPENMRKMLEFEEPEVKTAPVQEEPSPVTATETTEAESPTLKMSLKETVHAKKGGALFVVTMDARVERDVYDQLNRDAKRSGSGYSSFRGKGAIPGFQFRSREAAQAFLEKWAGEAAAVKEKPAAVLAANEVQPEGSPYIYTKVEGDWYWRSAGGVQSAPGNLMRGMALDFQDKLETLLAQKSETGIIEETPLEDVADDRAVVAADREDGGPGAQGPGTADLEGVEVGGETVDVPGRVRTGDGGLVSASLRGSVDENSGGVEPAGLRGEGEESAPGTARDLGTDPGGLAGILRPGAAGDLRIPLGGLTRTGSWKATAARNLDIIELIRTLEEQQRPATFDEQQLLMRYTGWGASEIRNKLFPGYAQHGRVMVNWAEADWKPLVERVVELLPAEDLKTAARSSQYAHYTSEAVTRSIWSALQRLGFAGGKVFEPGMGIGNFAGTMPDGVYAVSRYTGIEFDNLTAAIAKQLYPAQNIVHGDYTKQKFPNNFFDVAIGNPPFAQTTILTDPDYKKHKFSLHDYFFAKTIDKVRPGGLLAFVTSRYTLDKQGDKARAYLAERADLVGAIRLPQTAFKQHSGTKVVTDVIFLRKRLEGEAAAGEAWGGLAEVTIGAETKLINEYFVKHPEMVLGTHATESSQYASESYTVLPLEGDIEQLFAAAVQRLPANVYSVAQQPAKVIKELVVERDFNPKYKKEGGIYLADSGELMRVEFGAGAALESMVKLSAKDKAWLKDYVGLRDLLKQARFDQFTDGGWEKSLKALNRAYDAFVKQHGRIKDFTLTERKEVDDDGAETLVEYRRFKWQRLLKQDVEGPLLEALEAVTEDGEIVKAQFLKERTVAKPTRREPQSMGDALALSLDEVGMLDLDHVAALMKVSRAEATEALGDMVFETPEGRFELADEYLAGDVVTKLAEAEAAARSDDKYRRNVKALQAVQPKPLTPGQITAGLGMAWIPPEVVEEFAVEVLGLSEVRVSRHATTNTWKLEMSAAASSGYRRRSGKKPGVQSLRSATSDWGTQERGANEILDAVLNQRPIKITVTDSDKKTHVDAAATARVNEIADKMRTAFRSWIWTDAERAGELLELYNRKYNNLAPRRFDGSHLTLPGIATKYQLHAHQKRAIWRMIQTGNTYLAHAVGAGKTLSTIAAGMEMKRLGLISKPLYVVPNDQLSQWASEFMDAYPMANIMVADEENFHTSNRRRFMAQAAMNAPDAIIITHSALGKLRMQPESVAPVKAKMLSALREALDEAKDDGAPRHLISKMEKMVEQAEQRFDSIVEDGKGDNVLTFEELGADFLFVDECFTYDTLIETDRGPLAIGAIVENKLPVKVRSWNTDTQALEWKPVVSWYRHARKTPLIEVFHDNGSFICTPNHNIWTAEGYRQAGLLRAGDTLFALQDPVYSELHRQSGEEGTILLPGVQGCCHDNQQGVPRVRGGLQLSDEGRGQRCQAEILYNVLPDENAGQESGVHGKIQGKDAASMGEFADQGAEVARICAANEGKQPDGKPCDQGEEREGALTSRVVRVAILQPGGDGEYRFCGRDHQFVYDIEVADNHNYYANGVLVSNSHAFRKLDFTTVQQIKGIDPTGSRKALDLFLKVKWLEQQRPGRSLVFASGTPVTNTMGELYNVMRFFAEEQMERDDIAHFDAWAAMFGQAAVDYELNAAGRYEPVTRFAKFNNLPELMTRVRSFMDVLTSSNLSAYVKRPDLKGGAPENIVAPASEALKDYQETVLQPRMEATRKWKPSKEQPGNPDPIINIITDGRLSSIDMRYVGGQNDPNSKLNRVIDEIIRIHKATQDSAFLDKAGKPAALKGAAQVVFYNHGFGKDVAKNRGFDARAWINQRLKAAGIPASEVAWFDEFDTGAKQLSVLKDVREGKRRIIIGHARALGVGKNLQNRLYALHYIDPPWYPADVEQPHGRIIRQGNQHGEVVINWYATKGSYDSTMWQMVGRKGRFIEQAFMGDDSLRSMEDISEVSQYEMARALSSGDERIIKLVGLQAEVERLSRLKEAHYQGQAQVRSERSSAEWAVKSLTERIGDLKTAEKKVGGYVSVTNITGVVGKASYTKGAEFGAAVIEGFNQAMAGLLERDLPKGNQVIRQQYGSINGMALLAQRDGRYGDPGRGTNLLRVTEQVEMEVDDNLTLYPGGTDPGGLARRIVNKLNEVASSRSRTEDRVQEEKGKLTVLNKRIGAPFEHEQAFSEAIAELAQLQAELTAEGEPVAAEVAEGAEGDGADAPKFARGGSGVVALSDVEFDAIFERITVGMVNRDGFVTVPTASALPAAILAEIKKQGNRPDQIDGVFHSGKVYLVRENIASAARLEEVLFHEWHGHAGLYAMFGNDGAKLKAEMAKLYDLIGPKRLFPLGRRNNINLMPYGHALAKAGYNLETRKAIMMEEMLAHLTKEYSRGPLAKRIREVLGQIRAWLREHGFAALSQWGEADIAWLLKRARVYAEAGAWVKGNAPVAINGEEILARLREAGIPDEMLRQLVGAPKFAAEEKNPVFGKTGGKPLDRITVNGSEDLWTIPAEVERHTKGRFPSAPVRLMNGRHFGVHRGFGVAHIEAEHGPELAALGLSAQEYVYSILSRATNIRDTGDPKVLYVFAGGMPKGGAALELRLSDGGFYSVRTAFDMKAAGKIVWSGRTASPGVEQAPFTGVSRQSLPKDEPTASSSAEESARTDHGPGVKTPPAPALEGLADQTENIVDHDDGDVKFSLRDKAAAAGELAKKLTPDSAGLLFQTFSGMLPERMKAAVGSVLSNPHYGSRKSKHRAAAYALALEREANANEIKHEVMAREGDYEGLEGLREFYQRASKAEKAMIDKLLVEGDIQHVEFTEKDMASTDNPLGQVVPEVVRQAYRAFRQTVAASTETMFDRLGRLRLLPHEDTAYYQELIDLLDEGLTAEEVVRRFGIHQQSVDAYLQIRQSRAKLDAVTRPYKDMGWYSVLREALLKGLNGIEMQNQFSKAPELLEAWRAIRKDYAGEFATAEKFKKAQWYKTLADLLTVGDDHPMLQKLELYNAYRGVQEYDSQLAKLKEQWRTAKGYLPRLRKDGEQHVKVFQLGEDGTYTEVWMQPAKTVFGAGKLRDKVAANLKEYLPHSFDPEAQYEVVVEPNTATPEEIFLGIGSHRAIEALLGKVFDKAVDAGVIENQLAVQQQVLRILADEISARGFGRHRLARAEHLIEGYETENTPAILSQFVGSMAGWLSKSEFAMRANKVVSQIPATRPEDKVWVREYVDDALKNSSYVDQWFGSARSFAALMYLGFKASSALLNATQNYVWGQALLSKYTKGATRRLLQAQHDVVKDRLLVKAGKAGILDTEESWVLEEGLRRGRTHANYVRAMSGLDDNGGVLGKGQAGLRWLTDKAMTPFQLVEVYWNREPALLAAYRVFREQGMSREAALKKAEVFVDDVHFVVSKENIPGLLRKMGPVGRTLYTFQSYTHNYLLGMFTSLSKGEFAVVARSLTALVLFGGLAAVPFGDDLDKWYRRIFGERPLRMLEKWLRETAGEYTDFGDQVADFVLHGAPALAGVNFSNAIGVNVAWFSPEDETLAERVVGVWGGMAQKVRLAGVAAAKGDGYRAVESLSPEALANILRAYRLYADGTTTLSGRPVFGDDGKQTRYTAKDALVRAFGFMPLAPSKQTQSRWDARRAKDYWSERKADVLARFRGAKDRKEAMQLVRDFNRQLRQAPGGVLVPPITLQSLRQALTAKPDKRELAYLR